MNNTIIKFPEFRKSKDENEGINIITKNSLNIKINNC